MQNLFKISFLFLLHSKPYFVVMCASRTIVSQGPWGRCRLRQIRFFFFFSFFLVRRYSKNLDFTSKHTLAAKFRHSRGADKNTRPVLESDSHDVLNNKTNGRGALCQTCWMRLGRQPVADASIFLNIYFVTFRRRFFFSFSSRKLRIP